ncbi:hypothetical protein QUF80_12350 [Desulfococcaceae bacterium HSG8]|nr:hypothetical protein [Desulfococcaceae bacterium HSG8]
MSIRTEQHPGCSRGIVKSPAPHMLRICQSEPSSTLVDHITYHASPITHHASPITYHASRTSLATDSI